MFYSIFVQFNYAKSIKIVSISCKKRKSELFFNDGRCTHTVMPVAWLKKNGLSRSLIQSYLTSGRIKSVASGIVAKPEDKIEWGGFVWELQLTHSFHVGKNDIRNPRQNALSYLKGKKRY